MVGARRIQRALQRREALEADYRAALMRELERCVGGVWGLFGQNEHLDGARPSTAAQELIAMGDEIDAARALAGDGPFGLHARFVGMRGRTDENAPGEPKLARRLLDELRDGKA